MSLSPSSLPGSESKWDFAEAFQGLFEPARYKTYYGGRGGAKSWSIARALISKALGKRIRIGCFREFQKSIKDSVHRLLKDQINLLGYDPWFSITETSIKCLVTGSEFLFLGLHGNAGEIKSTEGIDIAWIEEAQIVTEESWQVLIPTIRTPGSEIWLSFNPREELDSTYQRFVIHPPPDSLVVKVSFSDNPWFPEELEKERVYMLRNDPDSYEHVWLGNPRHISESVIFKGRFITDEIFEAPDPVRYYHGTDFGFSGDPHATIRFYITGRFPEEELWINAETYAYGLELDEMAQLLDGDPAMCKKYRTGGMATLRQWPSFGDCSRPETISFLRRQGYLIEPADKWTGCVEDGIAHLKGFKKIHIHKDCPNMAQEARLYCWKVDKVTNQILPIIVDKNNHGWDATRYGLNGVIQKRGNLRLWEKLAG